MRLEDIEVSTKTIIAITNCTFDIVKIYKSFPVTTDPRIGSVEVMYYQNDYRGMVYADFKSKKKRSFRNAINVISVVEDGKKINFKLSKNGKFQMTGVKKIEQAILVIQKFVENIFTHCKDCLDIKENSIKVIFQTVMTNIDFRLGFPVDRQKLDEMMNRNTPFHSLLETSFGYTGVNIKFPMDMEWWNIPLPFISCDLEKMGEWDVTKKSLSDFIQVTDMMKEKKKYNTFLVFHSGSVIMSGMTSETMEPHFNIFCSIMKSWQNSIEEKLKIT